MLIVVLGNIFKAMMFISLIALECFIVGGVLFIIGKTVWKYTKKIFKLYEEKMGYEYRNLEESKCIYSDRCDGLISKVGNTTWCVMYEKKYNTPYCKHKSYKSIKKEKQVETTP